MTLHRLRPRSRRLWAAALAGFVLLLALVAMALPARLRIPRLAPHPAGAPNVAGAFSHVGHGSMPCYACHPSIFPQALVGFTHREMQEGRYCGACHDGGAATAIAKMSCGDCHAEP